MEQQRFRYLLLDLDGTLTDPKEGITRSVAYALNAFGIDVEHLDSLCPFIGPPLSDAFMTFYGFSEVQARKAVEKYRERYVDIGIFENRLYPGIDAFLKQRKACGQELILATSKPMILAERILAHFHIRHYFSSVFGSAEDGSRAAKSEVIRYALQACSITDFDRAVMIGDTCYDVVGARENNLRSLGVLYGFGSRESLSAAGVDFLVESVTELNEFFER